jgi:hypothetical protein
MIVPISLEQRVNTAAVIIEGEVVNQSCFIDSVSNHIYTVSSLKIFKLFKGTLASHYVSIITRGGTLGNKMERVSGLLQFKQGDIGVFMCELDTKYSIQGFKVVAGVQGFLQYDIVSGTVSDCFTTYPSFSEIHLLVTSITKLNYKQINPFPFIPSNQKVNSVGIGSITPSVVSAGTGNTITITGTGFGVNRGVGKVGFKYADNGGQTYIYPLTAQYKKWTDTEIIVEVPTSAGTGKIQVTNGVTATSITTLTVSYARTNEVYEEKVISPNLVDMGGGGYVWQLQTDFAENSNATDAFKRALVNWRCTSLVNWTIGDNTTVDVTDKDGINTVRFDTKKELPQGTLGVTYAYYNSCNGVADWYVNELDMLYSDTANWEFGPASAINKFDFESVCLHELGHAQMLGHVINSNDIMHYAIAPGQNLRSIGATNLSGAQFVLNESTSPVSCGPSAMELIKTSVCNDVSEGYFSFTGLTVSPNPFTTDCIISYEVSYESKVELSIFDVLGNKLASPVNAIQQKGKHSYLFSALAMGLSAGLYIATIEVDGTLLTNKFLMVK